MSNDQELQQKISEELRWDPRLQNADIGLAVEHGVVTLTGFVPTHAAKAAAVHVVERVRGVHAVVNELSLRVTSEYERTDKQIADAVLHALRWDVAVPDERIQVRVEHGWVILEGDVDWNYQRQAAETALHHLYGVKGVTDNLRIVTRAVSTSDVKNGIEAAIKRSAEEDARSVMVEAHQGTVTLRGSVRSWSERELAETAAWNSTGVTAVDNQIKVSNSVLT